MTAERERIGLVNLVAEQELAELEESRVQAPPSATSCRRRSTGCAARSAASTAKDGCGCSKPMNKVDRHFRSLFTTLFDGGQAHLELVESDDPLEAGLEIMAQPPGKRLQSLTLLSGGEQALTAIALIFALFLTNPAPICVLDEADAPLDDANVERFCDLLDRMTGETDTRYLIVTHNAVTMSRMHRLYGVTMIEKGVSRLVSTWGCGDLISGGVSACFVPPYPPRQPKPVASWRGFFGERARTSVYGWSEVAFETDHFKRNILGFNVHVVLDPDHVQHALLDNAANYAKPDIVKGLLDLIIGQGLLTADGELWREQRKIVAASFSPAAVEAQRGTFAQAARAAMDRWSDGGRRDMAADRPRTTMTVIALALFGGDERLITEDSMQQITAAIEGFSKPGCWPCCGCRKSRSQPGAGPASSARSTCARRWRR